MRGRNRRKERRNRKEEEKETGMKGFWEKREKIMLVFL